MGGIGMILNKMQPEVKDKHVSWGSSDLVDRKQEKHGWLIVTINGGW